MSIIVFIIIVLIVLALIIWAIRSVPNIDGTVLAILQVAAILLAAMAIAHKAGLL